MGRFVGLWAGVAALTAAPLIAQVQSVDPNTVIDADLGAAPAPAPAGDSVYYGDTTAPAVPVPAAPAETAPAPLAPAPGSEVATTYRKDDLIGAAESTLGKGAK